MPQTGETTFWAKDGIDYNIEEGQTGLISESVGQTTSGVGVVCELDYDAYEKWKQEMLGYSVITARLERVLPEPCGWDSNLYAMQIDRTESIKGSQLGETLGATDWPSYARVKAQVQFAAPLYQVREDNDIIYEHERYCIWERKLSAENLQLPGGAYIFPSDGRQVAQTAIMVSRTIELRCTWLDVPVLPYANISNCMNHINSAAITLNGVSYAAETLLFRGVDEKQRRNPFGRYTYDATYVFLHKADGNTWQQLLRKSAAGAMVYEAPTADGTVGGTKIYGTAAFLQLWDVS